MPPSLAHLIATGFLSGYSPIAPGTAGSLASLFLWIPVIVWAPLWLRALVVIAVLAVGLWATEVALPKFDRKDPQQIVVDEWAGLGIALSVVPATMPHIAAGFVLFRVLDILKPWPANIVDKQTSGALGVVLDDVVAGLYAGVAMLIIGSFF